MWVAIPRVQGPVPRSAEVGGGVRPAAGRGGEAGLAPPRSSSPAQVGGSGLAGDSATRRRRGSWFPGKSRPRQGWASLGAPPLTAVISVHVPLGIRELLAAPTWKSCL